VAARVHGKREHAIDHLRVVAARARALGILRKLAHGRFGVVECETVEWYVAELDPAQVEFEQISQTPLVLRGVLLLHLVGEAGVKVPACPLGSERPELWRGRCCSVDQLSADQIAGDLEHALEHRLRLGRRHPQDLLRTLRLDHARLAKARCDAGHEPAALARLFLSLAGR
jgi:hypothetical protein